MFYKSFRWKLQDCGYVITLTLRVATWLLPSVGQDGDHLCQYNQNKRGHDGPEFAHLYIGPRSRANFNPGAYIWTNLVDTNLKSFHDKYLSSSCKVFLSFYYTHIGKNNGGGAILSTGLLFEQTWKRGYESALMQDRVMELGQWHTIMTLQLWP
jgi:hypothetical protein